MSEKDAIYQTDTGMSGRFVFDEKVVRVFPDMIGRSVPGYEWVVPMTGLIARRYARPGSVLYDLGCSLGASSLAMRSAVNVRPVSMVAVDNSAAMVKAFQEKLGASPGEIPIEIREADVLDTRVENASVVVLNFTMQFIDPQRRDELIRNIHAGLNEGGVLILSEKIRFAEDADQARQTALHEDFKRAKGYSDLEIAGKRAALENVLRADTEQRHRRRLAAAGFAQVDRWFQCFSFCSYLAFK